MKKVLALLVVGLLVMSVSAFAAQSAKPEIFKGYLSDVLCGKAGKDPAGVDLTATPEKHTVKCMVAENCAKSGYGLFVLDEKTKKHVFYAFDAKGSELAKKDVLDKTKKAEGIYVEVKGTLDKEKGVLTLESVKEIEKEASK